jgi:Domain of unknown function (DUF4123)
MAIVTSATQMSMSLDSGSHPLGELLRHVSNSSKRVYALLDGAQFDDLPDALKKKGLAHRSLYKNVKDLEIIRAGPWLVDPYNRHMESTEVWGGAPFSGSAPDAIALDTYEAIDLPNSQSAGGRAMQRSADLIAAGQLELIFQLVGTTPAAIFWIGDAELTEARLWQHLRTLNMVLIPKAYLGEEVLLKTRVQAPLSGNSLLGPSSVSPTATAEASNRYVPQAPDTHEAVIFRHADGNVLAEVLPTLDVGQFARFFGPALELVFCSPNHPSSTGEAVRRAALTQPSPKPLPGLLRIDAEQMDMIERVRIKLTAIRVTAYLKNVASQQTQGLSESELSRHVQASMMESVSLGVTSEASHCRWAYMQLLCGGRLHSNEHVMNAMLADDTGISKNDRVRILMESTIERLRAL